MTDATGELEPNTNQGDPDVNVWSEYEIETETSLVDRPLRTLKHGDAFAVLDSFGDIGTVQNTPEGLFYRDIRYLSHYELRIEGKRPLLLSSAMHEDKAALSVDLTNPDVPLGLDRLPRLAKEMTCRRGRNLVWQERSRLPDEILPTSG